MRRMAGLRAPRMLSLLLLVAIVAHVFPVAQTYNLPPGGDRHVSHRGFSDRGAAGIDPEAPAAPAAPNAMASTEHMHPMTGTMDHGTHDPGHGTHDPADGTHDPGHGTHDPADGTHDPAHGTHDPSDDHGDTTHAMQMFFYVSSQATILFEQWTTSNWQQMLVSCIGVAIIAILYEGLKVSRDALWSNKQAKSHAGSSLSLSGSFPLGGSLKDSVLPLYAHTESVSSSKSNGCNDMCSGWHWLQTLLHLFQIFISYCLMLIFMTYNAWLCLSVCLGSALGYLFFGWMKMGARSSGDHCN